MADIFTEKKQFIFRNFNTTKPPDMANIFTFIDINITEPPSGKILEIPYSFPTTGDNKPTVTLPDGHGNTVHIITMLYYSGVISFEPAVYHKLLNQFMSNNIGEFRQILSSECCYKDHVQIRFLGDLTQNRGMFYIGKYYGNDAFTLAVLDNMQKNNIRYRILESNHGLIMVQKMLNYGDHAVRLEERFARTLAGMLKLIKQAPPKQESSEQESSEQDSPEQNSSEQDSSEQDSSEQDSSEQDSPERDSLEKEIILSQFCKCYLSHIALLDVDFPHCSPQNDGHVLSIYSHAPASVDLIALLAKKLGLHD